MADTVPIPERQEKPDVRSAETTHDLEAPAVPSPSISPVPSNALVPETYSASQHGSVPIPVMLPRAMYLFGWSRRDIRRGFGLLVTALIAVYFLVRVQGILPPFIIAFFLAALLDPTLRHMEAHGRSRVYAIGIIYLAALCIVVALAVFVVPSVVNQFSELSGNLDSYYANLSKSANNFLTQHSRELSRLGIKQHKLDDVIRARSVAIQASITAAIVGASGLVQELLGKVIWLVIIPISGFFFMRDFPAIRTRLIALFPQQHHEMVDKMSREIVDIFSAYLRGLAKIGTMYAATACFIFWLFGVRYALFLGLLAGLFYLIPYVGQVLTSICAGTVAYLMDQHTAMFVWQVPAHSITYALVVVVCIVIANNAFDQIMYPRVVGASVGLSPVVSIFALMSGATLFGVWGMLLATPIAASLQIILTYFFPRLTQELPVDLRDPQPTAESRV